MQAVRIDKKGRALDHVVAVKKSDDENVIWVALGKGGPWQITFDKDANGSPFDDDDYTVPQGGSVPTTGGPLNGMVGRTYKFNVRDASKPGKPITDDPDVDVE